MSSGTRAVVAVGLCVAAIYVVVWAHDQREKQQPPAPPAVNPKPAPKPEPTPAPDPAPRKLLWHYDRNSAQRQADEIGGVVLLYAYRDGCPPCARMWEEYLNTGAFSKTCLDMKMVPLKVVGTNVSTPRLVFKSGDRYNETLIGWQGTEKTERWLRK